MQIHECTIQTQLSTVLPFCATGEDSSTLTIKDKCDVYLCLLV